MIKKLREWAYSASDDFGGDTLKLVRRVEAKGRPIYGTVANGGAAIPVTPEVYAQNRDLPPEDLFD